jgi:uncharacterized membrane protein
MTNSKAISILAVIFSFLFFPVGLVLGIIGLRFANKSGDRSSKNWSIVAIVICCVKIVLWIIALVLLSTRTGQGIIMGMI